MQIFRHQTIAYLHLIPIDEVRQVHDFRSLDEFGLPLKTSVNVLTVVPRSNLMGLTDEQKDQETALFQKYKGIFSVDDHDLGCVWGVVHQLDTAIILQKRPWLIRHSQAAEDVITEEIDKLLQQGMLEPFKSL